jgi:two-component system, NarL family, sensor histidine kinase UhpB
MNIPIKILIAEHDPADIELLEHYLKKGNINCITLAAQTLNKIEDSLRNFKPDIILSDYNHPSFSGMDVFKLKQTVSPHIPFIFVSGAIGEENAIECIRQGVTDYALKDKLFTLPVKISRALHEAAEKRQKAKIEKELQQSEMNLRAIFNNTDTGFLLLDNIYNIVSYNLKASYFTKIMFGTEISSEQNFISLVPTVRKEEFVSIIEKIIDGETVDTETHYSQTDGITNWFRINGKPVFNRAGNVTNVSLAVYDITDSKRSQIKLNNIVKELTEKNNELQKTNIELDKFVYSTSHDLRNVF